MRDAVGGTVSLVIVAFFIVFALSYMAFNVNYTKAFRMKDKIISLYEDYGGECDSSECQGFVLDYANEIGYTSTNLNCPEGYDLDYTGLYCKSPVVVNNQSDTDFGKNIKNNEDLSDIRKKKYYKIVTKINIQIPIINNILDFSFFYISGDTKSFAIK